MKYRYKNTFYSKDREPYSNPFLGTDEEPQVYKGYRIFPRVISVKPGGDEFDIVNDSDECIGMCAGLNGAKARIDEIVENSVISVDLKKLAQHLYKKGYTPGNYDGISNDILDYLEEELGLETKVAQQLADFSKETAKGLSKRKG